MESTIKGTSNLKNPEIINSKYQLVVRLSYIYHQYQDLILRIQ